MDTDIFFRTPCPACKQTRFSDVPQNFVAVLIALLLQEIVWVTARIRPRGSDLFRFQDQLAGKLPEWTIVDHPLASPFAIKATRILRRRK
jgi:hypothetical protein